MRNGNSLVLTLALCFVPQVANADFIFGTPTNLGSSINSPADEWDMILSADELILIFSSDRSGGFGGVDLWMSTRQTASDPWPEPVNLGPTINSSQWDWSPSLSADGLTLYFSSGLMSGIKGGGGSHDVFVSMRESTDDPWGDAVKLAPIVNSPYDEEAAFISTDGLELYFSSIDNPGGLGHSDIWVSTRETKSDSWGEPVNLGAPVNTTAEEHYPSLSPDGLLLFFSSGMWGMHEDTRPGGLGDSDIWVARRKTRDSDWEEPVNLGSPVNSQSVECAPTISPDGSIIYFSFYPLYPVPATVNFGWNDLWQAPIIPIVDFNGDGVVDAADMSIIVDNWHTSNTLCDIAPAPLGDGFVDVKDMIVLAEHLFENVHDATLVAHWALDETEGMTARESVVGTYDIIMGTALWRPGSGRIDGALQFDGVDDCIIAACDLSPAEGSFSVVAWIKGGAPGQVIVSEPMGSNWLMVDGEGRLTTELRSPAENSGSLLSQTLIADGQWHRVALVWDGLRRTLCVDGVAVAEDTQNGLESSPTGLYIGVGEDFAPGTFFSGMIDDVRIYNRAVSP
ncbi:MAG: LamG-like jellyroll fold domain-containing protein [Planctomycetota bacterium]|jgi:Tol biopolymer transport system component